MVSFVGGNSNDEHLVSTSKETHHEEDFQEAQSCRCKGSGGKRHDQRSIRASPVVEISKPEPVTAEQMATGTVLSARTAAIRRSQAGKFNKVVLTVIGGAECPRFYPMTWAERDAYMAKPENTVVRERYEKHLASVTA
jgi:hypothetical protein